MEYILILLVLLLVWGCAYLFSPAKRKKWVFWGGFISILTILFFQFGLHPYRIERILNDLNALM